MEPTSQNSRRSGLLRCDGMSTMTANIVEGILLVLSEYIHRKRKVLAHNVPIFISDDEERPAKHIQSQIIACFLKTRNEGCDMPILTGIWSVEDLLQLCR
jgi:hypothetical protein